MDPKVLINICKSYQRLGWAVQEQLDEAIDLRGSDYNEDALEMIVGFLQRASSSLSQGSLEEFAEVLRACAEDIARLTPAQ